jgi:hypothetical protein
MSETVSTKLPPFREAYKLSDEQKSIIDRFKEELDHRLSIAVTFDVYKENHLAYPDRTFDSVFFEIRVGNWRSVQVISEVELDNKLFGSFYYFCRRIADKTMADLLKIGAARA